MNTANKISASAGMTTPLLANVYATFRLRIQKHNFEIRF